MDENKSPQDFFDEIFEKSQAAAPPVPPLRFGPPGDDPPPAPPPGEPAETRGAEAGAKLLPWLCVVLGAALLVLGVCLLQVTRLNDRLDGLQQMLEQLQQTPGQPQDADKLQQENTQLRQDISGLQDKIDQLEFTVTQLSKAELQLRQSKYLAFLQEFIDEGDLPMAAIVMVLADNYLRVRVVSTSFTDENFLGLDSLQQERYDRCRDALVEAGYLYNSGLTQKNGTTPLWADGWDPSENPDMAALGILWCALEGYYVEGDIYKPMQYLITYYYTPLGSAEDDALAYPQRLPNIAGEGAMRMYRQLIRDLCDSGYMVEDHGVLGYAPNQFYPDILYTLPFDLPVNAALIPIGTALMPVGN